jgi:hypothetical protein
VTGLEPRGLFRVEWPVCQPTHQPTQMTIADLTKRLRELADDCLARAKAAQSVRDARVYLRFAEDLLNVATRVSREGE